MEREESTRKQSLCAKEPWRSEKRWVKGHKHHDTIGLSSLHPTQVQSSQTENMVFISLAFLRQHHERQKLPPVRGSLEDQSSPLPASAAEDLMLLHSSV